MSAARHDPFDGLAALYAAGALDEEGRTAFETHLEVCLECVNEVKALLPVTHGLVHAALPLDAPAALRARVLEQVTGVAPATRGRRRASPAAPDLPFAALDESTPSELQVVPRRQGAGALFWVAAALLVAVAGAGGWYISELDRQIQGLRAEVDDAGTQLAEQAKRAEDDLAALRASAAEREAVLGIVTAPGVQQLLLTGQPLAPRASARAVWNESGEMVFLATGLPPLPEGDIYQLWFVLPDAPMSAALVEPAPNGDITLRLEVPDVVVLPAAMAMTIEPAGGVDGPTGDVYLLGQPIE